MLQQYRFVGSYSVVNGVEMTFGQLVVFTPDVAKTAIRGGCAIIPEETAQQIFEPGDFETCGDHTAHDEAPADFLARKRQAVDAYLELRRQETA